MLKSKSFSLKRKKRQTVNLRSNNPGRHLSTLFILLGLVGFITWFMMTNTPSEETAKYSKYTREIDMWRSDGENNSCTFTSGLWCTITCSNGEISEVSSFLEKQTSCGINVLVLNNIHFPNSMQKKWLDANFRIDELYLNNPDLEAIEDDAFQDDNFQKLKTLEITIASMPYLSNAPLGHLKSLKTLKLATSIAELSPDYLMGIKSNLVNLHINGIPNRKSPTDLIGNVPLEKIDTLDLDNNNFGDEIDEFTFQHVASALNVFLKGCQITSLGANSFNVFESSNGRFRTLDLRNNSLTVIQAVMLEHIINIGWRFGEIKLSENPWDCTYELLSLAQLIKEKKWVFIGDVICDSPPELEGQKLVPEILPSPPSTTTTSTTTENDFPSTTQSSTEGPTSTTTESHCPNGDQCLTASTTTENDFPTTTQSSTEGPTNTTTGSHCPDGDPCLTKITCSPDEINGLLVKKMSAKFSIAKISARSVNISVDFNNIDQNLTIMWFSDSIAAIRKIQMDANLYCLEWAPLQTSHFTISSLNPNKVYTFCVMEANATEISPLNCRSYFVKEDCSDDVWISEESETAVIILSVISILVAILLGAATMFCIMRYNADLLKGQKRVMIPKHVNVNKSVNGDSSKRTSKKSDLSMRKRSTDSAARRRSYVIPDYEIIPSRKSVTPRKDHTYFERLPEHSPPPLPKRRFPNYTGESKMTCSKLQLSDVAKSDDYFELYSGV